MGIGPEQGPGYTAEEHRRDAAAVILVRHRYWRQRLQEDPRALGRKLQIDGGSYTIAGSCHGDSSSPIARLSHRQAFLAAQYPETAGLPLAAVAAPAARWMLPDLPRLEEIGIDLRTVTFVLVAAVAVSLVCGLLPALRGTTSSRALAREGRSQVSAGHAGQWMLVGLQIALSVTLLAGAGLLLRSSRELAQVQPGFDPDGVLAFRLSGSWAETVDRERLTRRIETTLEELAALPGAVDAATSWALPGRPESFETEFELEGGATADAPVSAEWRTMSPGYFDLLGMPLHAGEPCRHVAAGSGRLRNWGKHLPTQLKARILEGAVNLTQETSGFWRGMVLQEQADSDPWILLNLGTQSLFQTLEDLSTLDKAKIGIDLVLQEDQVLLLISPIEIVNDGQDNDIRTLLYSQVVDDVCLLYRHSRIPVPMVEAAPAFAPPPPFPVG